jgi:catechol 2,3-dioxygenase-like lactoylglutathione lyase family enzyme
MSAVLRLDRLVLVCDAPLGLAHFYEQALGFTCSSNRIIAESALGALLGVPDARAQCVTLTLGEQRVDLVRIEPAGRAYPEGILGPSALFQHFAIEVPDMSRAMARLGTQSAWTSISVGGPQTLPPASGGVTAFKFKDPEGHPLELITAAQPAAGAAGYRISHSAISVASTALSVAFYERLGLARTGGSLNTGPEQDRLDGLPAARVEVTALNASRAPEPHLELLCYADRFEPAPSAAKPNDIAADWLVFTVRDEADLRVLLRQIDAAGLPTRFADGTLRSLVHDPDGHWLCLEAPANSPQPPVANPG